MISVVDAALQGFYLAERRPWLVAAWALAPLAGGQATPRPGSRWAKPRPDAAPD